MELLLRETVSIFDFPSKQNLYPSNASFVSRPYGGTVWRWGDRSYSSFQEMKDSWIWQLEDRNARHEREFGIGDLTSNYEYCLERQALIEEIKLLEDPTLEKT